MKFYGVSFFVDKDNPIVPTFNRLSGEDGITLCLGSNDESYHSQVTIFLDGIQDATNFKNKVLQSWEAFLRGEYDE